MQEIMNRQGNFVSHRYDYSKGTHLLTDFKPALVGMLSRLV